MSGASRGAWVTHTLKVCCTDGGRHDTEWLGSVRFGIAADGSVVVSDGGESRRTFRCRACPRAWTTGGSLQRKRSRRDEPTQLARVCAVLVAASPGEPVCVFDIALS